MEIHIIQVGQKGQQLCYANAFRNKKKGEQHWSDPRIIFVFVDTNTYFVFVYVIQFVCGPKIYFCLLAQK